MQQVKQIRDANCSGMVMSPRSSGLAKTILQGTTKGGRRQGGQKKEVGRQHQGMDNSGVRQVPEGSGEQSKKEETGCEVICGTPTTPAVKG